MNTQKDIVSQITRYIPLFSVLSLMFGSISLFAFYHNYGINIISYLELNEIISQTMKDFIVISFMGLIYVVSGYFLSFTSFGENYKTICSNTSFIKAIISNRPFFIVVIVLISVITATVITSYRNAIRIDTAQIYTATALLPLILLLTFIELNRRSHSIVKVFPSLETISIVLFSVVVIFMAVTLSFLRHSTLKINDNYLKNSIVIDKKIIKSTPTYYFIGKTKEYVFFFNEKDSVADVFPISTIQQLTLNR